MKVQIQSTFLFQWQQTMIRKIKILVKSKGFNGWSKITSEFEIFLMHEGGKWPCYYLTFPIIWSVNLEHLCSAQFGIQLLPVSFTKLYVFISFTPSDMLWRDKIMVYDLVKH